MGRVLRGYEMTVGERDFVRWVNCGVDGCPAGVTIGEGAAIASGAVVTTDIEPFIFVAPTSFQKKGLTIFLESL